MYEVVLIEGGEGFYSFTPCFRGTYENCEAERTRLFESGIYNAIVIEAKKGSKHD